MPLSPSPSLDSLIKDEENLHSFYDFPAAHWQTVRSTNVIESSFATVRLRQRITKGAATRTRGTRHS
jgi:transposase-like protein